MINRKTALGLAIAAAYIAGALALKVAEKAGLLPHETTIRTFQALTGLGLALYANFLPKRVPIFRGPMAAMRSQSVLRASGRAFVVGGLGYAAASILPVADAVPMAILSAATAYVLGYTTWAYVECETARRRAV